MNKIALIIQREYVTRVRKKSFIIMTILGPVLMAALFIVPAWIALNSDEEQDILVVDESYVFIDALESTETIRFHYPQVALDSGIQLLQTEEISAILYIPPRILMSTSGVKLMYEKQPGITAIRFIENAIGNEIERLKLSKSGIDKATIEAAKTDVKLITTKLDDLGKEEDDNTEKNMIIGMMAGVLIYLFIFLYGVQVMRGVIEEKTNRIIEVIISSVKPFQLMMGKIVGIGLVSLTQFLLWMILSSALISVSTTVLKDHLTQEDGGTSVEQLVESNSQMVPEEAQAEFDQDKVNELMDDLDPSNYWDLVLVFVFYFLGGYLLYSALFAAVGSAVDNESDTQQFMLPITIPIIFSFVMAQAVIQNPDSALSFWLSVIPLTSPIIMMVRYPFGVPVMELGLSMAMLVVGFIFTTWIAAKIYRTGILMYGKKPSFKEIWKWIRMS